MHQILIVEDDPALSQGIRLALGQEGRQFVQAGTIGQAERELAERTFDLLILDLNLPDGNGLDLLSRLRDRSALPVLILTANDLEMDQVTGLELGADDYVTKPFSLAVLRARRQLERMDRMLDRAIDGSFLESSFDESVPSALESKMSRFLNGSASSARNLAEEKSKIAALIADVSHQTKTPIANLLLYASLLAESELTPEQRAQAEALKTQAEKLSFLVDALVKSSRLDNGILTLSPAPHPIQPLLDGAAAQGLAAARQRGISLTVLPWEGAARFDSKWTAEALYNVLDNALKYTPPGGTVTLSVTAYHMFCCIQVSDTGPGIPEEEQAQIFSRFYRGAAVREQEGLGLGLYLTRRILTSEGGYIRVSSQPGKGSTFSLYLPLE